MKFALSVTFIFGVSVGNFLLAYDYPMKPFDARHKIIATLGESRGDRFHTGVDIKPYNTTVVDSTWLVYALESDTMIRIDDLLNPKNNGVYDKQEKFFYIHLYNRIASGTWATAFEDTIGRIRSDAGHIHLTEKDTNGVRINPLRSSALEPFLDTVPPIIESVSFKRQGSGTNLHQDSLADSVDIVVRVYDPRVDTTGAGSGRAMGIYKNEYSILDILMNPISGASNTYQFDSLPLNSITARYSIVYHDSTQWEGDTVKFYYWVTNAPFEDTSNQYWNTKQHINREWYNAPAESIEVAKFKDGLFNVKIRVWDICRPSFNPCDSAIVCVHVDNFDPKVKWSRPSQGFGFVPTGQKKLTFMFSEAMDTSTLNTTNIKIQSMKPDSTPYTITNISYNGAIHELTLEVDTFSMMDTVQVRFYNSITDLAGKCIDDTTGEGTIAYKLTFVVTLKQITDNSFNDIYPDVHQGKVVWTQAPANDSLGEIWLYDLYNDTSYQISLGGGIHTNPYIYENNVAWVGYGMWYSNPVYYYNGSTSTTQQIALPDRWRYSMEISDGGVAWRSFYPFDTVDTAYIEYYNPDTGSIRIRDKYEESQSYRYYGRCDIDGYDLVWDRKVGNQQEVYYYHNGSTDNISNDTSKYDAVADLSDGQIAWLKEGAFDDVWLYDGQQKRVISEVVAHSPMLDNGSLVWTYGIVYGATWKLNYFDGRDTLELMSRQSSYYGYWSYMSVDIHNDQVAWLRLVSDSGDYNVSFYDGNDIMHLTVDSLDPRPSCRVSTHNGFVVFDAWDGNDYEIYLFVGDTLFTPPGAVENMCHNILEEKSNEIVELTWDPNTETDLAGYKIYRSATAYDYGTIPYATTSDTTYTDNMPMDGSNYYVATAYDSASNEGGFSNQTEAFIDVYPPNAITELMVTKSDTNTVLTWDKITTDTLGNEEYLDYYVIYRDTLPNYVPSPSDSIGSTNASDTTFTDTSALVSYDSYFYLVMAVDSSKNRSAKSNMGFALYKPLVVDSVRGGHNWVSLPWYNDYSTASDISGDLSPAGDPLFRLTNLRDDQFYEQWIWSPPLEGWTGTNFSIISGRGYKMETSYDTSLYLVGSNNPDGLIAFNENPGPQSDRNWPSIPYNAIYATISDVTDEYSPAGDPLIKLTKQRDDMYYVSWIWDPWFEEWFGTDFDVEIGRGYEFISTTDTTWNPTEYTNISDQDIIIIKRTIPPQLSTGTKRKLNRSPSWRSVDNEYVPFTHSAKKKRQQPESKEKTLLDYSSFTGFNNQRDSSYNAYISHIVRGHIIMQRDMSNLIFTAYRLNNPASVLTQDMLGSGIVYDDSLIALYFDIGNFDDQWFDDDEVMLLIESVVNGRGHFAAILLRLDAAVDIQDLPLIILDPLPAPRLCDDGMQWDQIENDNIIGYSIYKGSTRLNDRPIQSCKTKYKDRDICLRPIVKGGYETIYSSNENIFAISDGNTIPIKFTFNVQPLVFTKRLNIKYALPQHSLVRLNIYDAAGRLITPLVSEKQPPGYYSLTWDCRDHKDRTISAGVYFVQIETDDNVKTEKIIMLR